MSVSGVKERESGLKTEGEGKGSRGWTGRWLVSFCYRI